MSAAGVIPRSVFDLLRVLRDRRRGTLPGQCEADGPVKDRQGEQSYHGDVHPVWQEVS